MVDFVHIFQQFGPHSRKPAVPSLALELALNMRFGVASILLQHMRQLMAEQSLAVIALGPILSFSEHDIRPQGERASRDRSSRGIGLESVWTRTSPRSTPRRGSKKPRVAAFERLAGRTQHFVDGGWISSTLESLNPICLVCNRSCPWPRWSV